MGKIPEFIVPMLAKFSQSFGDDNKYAYEIKWDGIRSILFLEMGKVRLQSRNLLDITSQYPELWDFDAGLPLKIKQAIFDGEIVCFDEHNRPSFECLQNRMHLA